MPKINNFDQTTFLAKAAHYCTKLAARTADPTLKRYFTTLNTYLENLKGLCHGLTIYWIVSLFDDDEKQFFNFIEKMVTRAHTSAQLTQDLIRFLNQCFWFHLSDVVKKDIHQYDFEFLIHFVGGKTISLDFLFTCFATERTLTYFLDQIPNEKIVSISGNCHTIGIKKMNTEFKFYDSNSKNKEATILVNSEQATKKIIEATYEAIKPGECKPFVLAVIGKKDPQSKIEYDLKSLYLEMLDSNQSVPENDLNYLIIHCIYTKNHANLSIILKHHKPKKINLKLEHLHWLIRTNQIESFKILTLYEPDLLLFYREKLIATTIECDNLDFFNYLLLFINQENKEPFISQCCQLAAQHHSLQILTAIEKIFSRQEIQASINQYDENGLTTFHLAIITRSPLNILEQLVKLGSDPKQTTKKGQTTLFLAINRENYSAFNFLQHPERKQQIPQGILLLPDFLNESLTLAILQDTSYALKELLILSQDLSQTRTKTSKRNPLHLIAITQKGESYQFLKNIFPQDVLNLFLIAPDSAQLTPIDYALMSKNKNTIQLFMHFGFDPVKYLISLGIAKNFPKFESCLNQLTDAEITIDIQALEKSLKLIFPIPKCSERISIHYIFLRLKSKSELQIFSRSPARKLFGEEDKKRKFKTAVDKSDNKADAPFFDNNFGEFSPQAKK